MPSTLLINANVNGLVLGAGTAFPFMGESILGNPASEANSHVTWRTAGTFSALYGRVLANTATAASSVTLRKNGTSQANTFSIGSASTGEFFNVLNTTTVASGDNINYETIIGAGGSCTFASITSIFVAGTGMMTKLLCASIAAHSIVTASSTEYDSSVGQLAGNTTESSVQFKAKSSTGTLTNFFVNISANARPNATTFNSRVASAPGNLLISVGSDSTGIMEDTSHADVLASNALFCTQNIVGSGTANINIFTIGLEYVDTLTAPVLGGSLAMAVGTGSTVYIPVGGILAQNATEANAQCQALTTHTASNLEAHVSANAATTAATLTFRVGGAPGNQTISIGSHATGYFEDTFHTDVISSITTEINYQLVTGTGGNITFNNIGYWMLFPSGTSTYITLLPLLGVG